MKAEEEILRLLKEKKGAYLSGTEISTRFAVSRTAVWKQIKILRAMGYGIDASSRRGYRLVSVPDRLVPSEVTYGLKTEVMGQTVHHFQEVSSTIDVARQLALDGYSEGTLVVAEQQTGGRGRLERQWFSPPGGIWMSLILRPSFLPADAPKITFLMAVACAQAIETQTGLQTGIKWPNDVLVAGKKVGGILSEIDAEPDRIMFAILSLGLDVNVEMDIFPEHIKAEATSLKEQKGERIDRVKLLQEILANFQNYYERARKGDFSTTLVQWKARAETLKKRVRVSTPYGVFEGIASDIDEHGALLLKLPSGEIQAIASGDATLL